MIPLVCAARVPLDIVLTCEGCDAGKEDVEQILDDLGSLSDPGRMAQTGSERWRWLQPWTCHRARPRPGDLQRSAGMLPAVKLVYRVYRKLLAGPCATGGGR